MAERVGVLGATSLVGAALLPQLRRAGYAVTAFSRRLARPEVEGVQWCDLREYPLPGPLLTPSMGFAPSGAPMATPFAPGEWVPNTGEGDRVGGMRGSFPPVAERDRSPLPLQGGEGEGEGVIHSEDRIAIWICLAPIWVLPDHFALLEAHGARRVVALSSTSRYTKQSSPDPHEQALSRRLAEGEAQFMAWAGARGVTWTILQPTLIYGLGRDRNIGAIAHFIRRFGFFPLCGPARGLRQPLHAEDVAAVCLAAIEAVTAANRTYTISGGEMLSYREMVDRVFAALGRRSRFLTIPPVLLRLALACWRVLPGEHTGSVAMAERMNQDLVFDHADAARDLGFAPRSFHPTREDLPS